MEITAVTAFTLLLICLIVSRCQVRRLRRDLAARDEELAIAIHHQSTAAAIIAQAHGELATTVIPTPRPKLPKERPWYLQPVKAVAGLIAAATSTLGTRRDATVTLASFVIGAIAAGAFFGGDGLDDERRREAIADPKPPVTAPSPVPQPAVAPATATARYEPDRPAPTRHANPRIATSPVEDSRPTETSKAAVPTTEAPRVEVAPVGEKSPAVETETRDEDHQRVRCLSVRPDPAVDLSACLSAVSELVPR